MELIIASNNEGKLKEYKDVLTPLGFKVYSQKEKGINIEVEETGTTFKENARLKAKAIYDITKCYVISDDSGLEIEALNNEPGIYSARYKGIETEEERRKYILNELKNEENRNAKFTTCICYINKNGKEKFYTGVWKGIISTEEKGTEGFGYDPIFISNNGKGRTTAELGFKFKEKYSHRTKAVKKLLKYLNEETKENK